MINLKNTYNIGLITKPLFLYLQFKYIYMGRYTPCRKYNHPKPPEPQPKIEYKGYDKLYEYYLGLCLKCSEQTENAIARDMAIRSTLNWYLIANHKAIQHIDKQIYKIIAKKHDKDAFIEDLVQSTVKEIINIIKSQDPEDRMALSKALLEVIACRDINPEIVYVFEDWVKQVMGNDDALFMIKTDYGNIYRRDFVKIIAIHEVIRNGMYTSAL